MHQGAQDRPQAPLLARQRTQAQALVLTQGETMEATAAILEAMMGGMLVVVTPEGHPVTDLTL